MLRKEWRGDIKGQCRDASLRENYVPHLKGSLPYHVMGKVHCGSGTQVRSITYQKYCNQTSLPLVVKPSHGHLMCFHHPLTPVAKLSSQLPLCPSHSSVALLWSPTLLLRGQRHWCSKCFPGALQNCVDGSSTAGKSLGSTFQATVTLSLIRTNSKATLDAKGTTHISWASLLSTAFQHHVQFRLVNYSFLGFMWICGITHFWTI